MYYGVDELENACKSQPNGGEPTEKNGKSSANYDNLITVNASTLDYLRRMIEMKEEDRVILVVRNHFIRFRVDSIHLELLREGGTAALCRDGRHEARLARSGLLRRVRPLRPVRHDGRQVRESVLHQHVR